MGPAQASTSVLVTATPEQVFETSRQWARRLGLVVQATRDDAVIFCFPRFSRVLRNLALEVGAWEKEDGRTHVLVTSSVLVAREGLFEDMKRIAQAFAIHVCSELARQGAEVEPRELGWDTPHTGLLWKYGRIPLFVYFALEIVLVPAMAAGAIFFHNRSAAAIFIALWILLLTYVCGFVRVRLLGAQAGVMVLVAWIGFVAALIITVIPLLP